MYYQKNYHLMNVSVVSYYKQKKNKKTTTPEVCLNRFDALQNPHSCNFCFSFRGLLINLKEHVFKLPYFVAILYKCSLDLKRP